MPKKGGKGKGGDKKGGKGGKDGEVDVTVIMRKVKTEMAKVIAELGVAPELEVDKFLISKIQEAVGESQTKLIFTGDKPTTLSIQVLSAVLKELCPVPLTFKAMCFWKMVLGDDAIRDVCLNLLPIKKREEPIKYPGYSVLEIVDCRVNHIGCAHIAQALRTDIPLQSLTLDFNHIGDEGVMSLAEGLRYNKDLTHLSLAYCRIGPRGGSVIGTQIIRESKVKKILLPGNRILIDGLLAIALNLGKSTTVTTLDLCDNSISGDVSVISFLCEGLRSNSSLESVNLTNNVIGVDAAELLRDTLPMCDNIKFFRVGAQGIPAELYKEVCVDGKKKKGGKKGKKKKK